MKKIKRVFCCILLLGLAAALAAGTADAKVKRKGQKDGNKAAAVEASVRPRKMLINFVDVDISAVTDLMSKLTGKNFIYGSDVSGKITITSTSKVTAEEAFDLFVSVLKLRGFTVVPAGGAFKIIPAGEVRQAPLEVVEGSKAFRPNDTYMAMLIKLSHMQSADLIGTIQPLVSKDGFVSTFGKEKNALLVVDNALNLNKILKLVKLADVEPAAYAPEIIYLKNSQADGVAQALRQARAARTGKSDEGPGQGAIIAEKRLNAIVLNGTPEENELNKRMIEALDVPAPDASAKVNVYYLENAEAAELAKVLEGLKQAGPAEAQRVSIMPDRATNSLLIIASPEDYAAIAQVVRKLDRRPRQVFVEAMITEVSIDKTLELGTKWRAAAQSNSRPILIGGAGTVDSTVIQQIVSGMTGFTLGGLANFMDVPVTKPDGTVTTLSVPGFAALFSLSEFKDAVDVLSTPHILTSDNREAEIMVGENVPFLSKLEREAGTLNQPLLQSIERRDVGITLKIKPQISEGDFIRLDIYQEISAVAPNSGSAADIITTKRSAKTSVVVKDKQTVVIGGLIQDRITKDVSKVPLLGDIPILGWLFKSESTRKEKANLLVYLTPTIIKDFGSLDELKLRKEEEYRKGTGAPSIPEKGKDAGPAGKAP